MHIENLTGNIQCTSRTFGWLSSRWALEDVDGTHSRIRNAWQSNNHIHVEHLNGNAQHGTIYPSWWSAQWELEAIGSARLLNHTVLRETEDAKSSEVSLSVYPNAVSKGTLRIRLDGMNKEEYSVQIFDVMGKAIFYDLLVAQYELEISVADFESGMYILHVQNPHSSFKLKFLVE